MQTPKLYAEDVNLYYGKHHALKNVSLSFPDRQVTSLIGPSGCGKSTFLRTLNRMNDLIGSVKITGSVVFEGKNIYQSDIDVVNVRRKVGMVFQRPNPFAKTIFDNVAYGLRIAGITNKKELEDRVENSLRCAALWDEVKDRLHQHASNLSGGQQQRLCIARALAVEPEVILMDEPASALDPIATEKLEQSILQLRENLCVIIVTHNMQQAKRISDRTAFFYMGELIEDGATDVIFSKPNNERTFNYVNGRFG